MKKNIKKTVPRLIVDQFQKIKKSQYQPTSKSSYSNQQKGQIVKRKIQQIVCKYCHKYIPQPNIIYHNKICQRTYQQDDQYDMIYHRPQNKFIKQQEIESIRKSKLKQSNYDYYPFNHQQRQIKNTINKSKRPMSAMNKKNQIKPKLQIKIPERQIKLTKTSSTSKLKQELKHINHMSKQKNRPTSKYQQIYIKNIGNQKKYPLSIGQVNNTKLKKKNGNFAQKFTRNEKQQEKSIRRPDSHSKKQQKIKQKRRLQLQDHQQREQHSRKRQREKQRQREQIHLDHPQITTKQLKQIVRGKLREEKERQHPRRPQQEAPRQNIRPPRQNSNQQRQPIRTEVRNQRENERQPRPQRNQQRRRNQNYQRYPRRNQRPNRNSRQPNNLINLVSQTINNQLQMINNQFSVVSNIFENLSNFVNINIESHPNYYQFTSQDMNTSSQYNSDSSNSYSSDYYDDYYEDSEPQGMDDEQLNSIQNKRYTVQQHGQNQCTICLVELRNGDIIKQLFCDHVFHSQCIQEWLRRKSACPVCRDQLGPS